jgi:hypothetical protein
VLSEKTFLSLPSLIAKKPMKLMRTRISANLSLCSLRKAGANIFHVPEAFCTLFPSVCLSVSLSGHFIAHCISPFVIHKLSAVAGDEMENG